MNEADHWLVPHRVGQCSIGARHDRHDHHFHLLQNDGLLRKEHHRVSLFEPLNVNRNWETTQVVKASGAGGWGCGVILISSTSPVHTKTIKTKRPFLHATLNFKNVLLVHAVYVIVTSPSSWILLRYTNYRSKGPSLITLLAFLYFEHASSTRFAKLNG